MNTKKKKKLNKKFYIDILILLLILLSIPIIYGVSRLLSMIFGSSNISFILLIITLIYLLGLASIIICDNKNLISEKATDIIKTMAVLLSILGIAIIIKDIKEFNIKQKINSPLFEIKKCSDKSDNDTKCLWDYYKSKCDCNKIKR